MFFIMLLLAEGEIYTITSIPYPEAEFEKEIRGRLDK